MTGSRILIFACHVYLGTKHLFAVCKLALGHAAEEVEILLDRTVAVGAVFAGLGQGAAVFAYFIGRQVADIRLALLDELYRALVEEVKIARGIIYLVPLVAEPLDILFNGVDVFDILLGGVGVVETEVANAAVLLGNAEIDANSLCVADMQVAVRLRRNLVCTRVLTPFARSSSMKSVMKFELRFVLSAIYISSL